MVGVRAEFIFPFVGFGFCCSCSKSKTAEEKPPSSEVRRRSQSLVEGKFVMTTSGTREQVLGGVFVDLEAEDAVVVDGEGEEQGFGIGLGTRFGGETLAKQLASLRAKLIISARNEAELNRVKTELKGKHAPDEVKILPLDLSFGEDSLRNAVEKEESFFLDSGVDYMIHNAVLERPKTSILDITEEGLKMSSAAGKTPAPGLAIYSATKYALNGYFHTLRSESTGAFFAAARLSGATLPPAHVLSRSIGMQ